MPNIIQASSLRNRIYQGPQGNASVVEGNITLKALADGDGVELTEFPIGMRLYALRIHHDALGVNVKGTFKVGDHILVSDVNLNTTTPDIVNFIPYTTQAQNERLTVTFSGGAATGKLVVITEYTPVGY